MRLYYRADTRNPKTIFNEGFKAIDDLWTSGNDWWQYAIRGNDEAARPLIKTSTTDVNMSRVVCLSKKLESTPIFPVCDQYHTDYDSEIYIYVMVLPDAELPENTSNKGVTSF